MTDPNGRIPRSLPASSASQPPPPRSASEFAAYFRTHAVAQQNAHDMDLYYGEFVGKPSRQDAYRTSVALEHASHTRPGSPYLISIPMQARALMVRRWQILMGSKETVVLDML